MPFPIIAIYQLFIISSEIEVSTLNPPEYKRRASFLPLSKRPFFLPPTTPLNIKLTQLTSRL
jgi:hypothetical protein